MPTERIANINRELNRQNSLPVGIKRTHREVARLLEEAIELAEFYNSGSGIAYPG